jgi:DNA-directed RNA polymerase sigma subunit (sigma70/sigma32)
MNRTHNITDETLASMTPRRRAVLKLRLGMSLSEMELEKVVPSMREAAKVVQPRSLRGVARFFGLSKERIRQIENRVYEMLDLQAQLGRQEDDAPAEERHDDQPQRAG